MITYENKTYKDTSELAYHLIKQGKSLWQICEAIGVAAEIDNYDMMVAAKQVKFKTIKCITEDSWLFNTTFELFEFVSIFITAATTYSTQLGKTMVKWINNHTGHIVEYDEKYQKHIATVLTELKGIRDDNLLNVLTIFQNYLNDDIITKLCSDGKLKEEYLKQILNILNKSHLYNHYLFITKIKK